jgi:hypothetical protein
LRYPEMAAQEIYRVCKPGATIKIDTAFLQPMHGYPNHYFNATLSGLKHWFRDFSIEWEGVEDYQHPSLALDWILRSYIDGMSTADAEVFQNSTIRELVATISSASNGETVENQGLFSCMYSISAEKKRELAAGVSILATKDAAATQGVFLAQAARPGAGSQDARAEAKIAYLENKLHELERLLKEKHAMLVIKNEVEDVFNREYLRLPIVMRQECPWLAVWVGALRRLEGAIKKRLGANG